MNKVFYCKGRPQGADIADFSVKRGRVFIGYPPRRHGEEFDQTQVHDSIVNVGSEDPSSAYPKNQRMQFTKNRNFVRKIDSADKAYVLVPRPGQGVCFVGLVTGKFRVENNPDWADEYLSIRKEQKLDVKNVASHVGDVVQCWPVKFRKSPIPFTQIPGWIRYQIMGRVTAGIVHDTVDGIGELSVAEIAQKLYEDRWSIDLSPTLDPKEIERRLIRWLTPTSFEHLAVSILQLENPKERWLHVGGSGDGGADGLAIKNGKTVSVLQCKWKYNGSFDALAEPLRQDDDIRVFIASLIHDQNPIPDNILDRAWFVEKIRKHCDRLPEAMGLGIGN